MLTQHDKDTEKLRTLRDHFSKRGGLTAQDWNLFNSLEKRLDPEAYNKRQLDSNLNWYKSQALKLTIEQLEETIAEKKAKEIMTKEITFEEGSGNVFKDLDLPNPEALLLKSEIIVEIRRQMLKHRLSIRDVARITNVSDSSVEDMLKGKSPYSLTSLVQFYNDLGGTISLKFHFSDQKIKDDPMYKVPKIRNNPDLYEKSPAFAKEYTVYTHLHGCQFPLANIKASSYELALGLAKRDYGEQDIFVKLKGEAS